MYQQPIFSRHNRECFFKYLSAESAHRVISSKSLKWSSPLIFNDPFDHQTGFQIGFDGEEFAQGVMAAMERIIFDSNVVIEKPTRFAMGALSISDSARKQGREKLRAFFEHAKREMADNLDSHINAMHESLVGSLCRSRVLSVTEENDNVVMWSHYADQHKGVVLKLRCIPEIDNSLLLAQKVEYSRKFVEFPPLQEFLLHLTGEREIDMAKLAYQIAFRKHENWSYENEWRVCIPLQEGEPDGDGFSIYVERPEVFDAAYLGCRMEKSEIEIFVEEIKKYLPHIKIYRTQKSDRSFALNFHEI